MNYKTYITLVYLIGAKLLWNDAQNVREIEKETF